MPVSFMFPEALLVGALLLFVYWRFMKHRNPWRTALVILAVLLLAFPYINIRSRNIDLFVLLDRSRSISPEGIAKQNELLQLASDRLQPGDRASVVSFNEKAFIEHAPGPGPISTELNIPYSADASDLTDGLATIASLASPNRQTRVLVLSDGEYTGQSPIQQAQVARQLNLPIYVRDLKRLNVENLFVSGADTDEKILAGEPFRVLFRVQSTVDMPGRYRIYRNSRIVGEETDGGWRTYNFRAGENRITFTDTVGVTGIHGYRIVVETTPADREKVTTDNTAEKFISVLGDRPILIVNNDGQKDNVSTVLSSGGIPVHITAISNYRLNINQLAGYKGIILNNVPITGLAKTHIDDIGHFVTQEGGGLLVFGGNRSFGAGGYYRSALEDILPVALDDRRQNKKVATAFSFVLDRSGSMAMTVPSGQTKMDLANAAAVESLNLLGPGDSISVVAVDSAAHIFVPQRAVENPGEIASRIRSIESMGGGIFAYTALVAAGSEIAGAPQDNKHILMFSDAADTEEPGDYKNLLKQFTDAGITVSAVGLGTENDPDAAFIRDIAERGGGQAYFTEDPHQLIQFFTADTIQYTRKNFIEDPAPMRILPSSFTLSPEHNWQDFSSANYNLLFPRPGADIAIATANGDDSPILAFWQRGLGRVAALALDAGAGFSANPDFPNMVLNSARWIMGSTVNDSFQVQSQTDGNYARISMEISDEQRATMGQARLLMFAPDGTTIERPLQWDSWNRLSSDIRLTQTGAWRGVIQVGEDSYRVGPVSMPVSPEFAWRGDNESGREVLLQLAAATGGREVTDIAPLFERSLTSVSRKPLVLPLLILMMLALLGEIAESRFNGLERLIASIRRRFQRGATPATSPAASSADTGPIDSLKTRLRKPRRAKTPPTPESKPGPAAAAAGKKQPAPEPGKPASGDMEYLSAAKARARRSMKDKKDKP